MRFTTTHQEYRITDSPFAVPSKLGRYGLCEVINHLLGNSNDNNDENNDDNSNSNYIEFDFLIGTELVRLPLHKFLAINNISSEGIVNIEYFPRTKLSEESNSVEVPAWVGCLAAINSNSGGNRYSNSNSGNSAVVAGCYDGTVKIYDAALTELSTFQAHSAPIRSIITWSTATNSVETQLQTIATASKDQTVKYYYINTSNTTSITPTVLKGHVNSVESLAVLPNTDSSALLFSGDWSGNIFSWKLPAPTITNRPSDSNSTKKRKKDKSSVEDTENYSIATVDDLKPQFTIRAHTQSVSGIHISNNSSQNYRLFTCSWDHSLKEWDMERQESIATCATSKVMTSLDYSCLNELVTTSHPDGKVRFWDMRQKSEAATRQFLGGRFGSDVQWISQVIYIFK